MNTDTRPPRTWDDGTVAGLMGQLAFASARRTGGPRMWYVEHLNQRMAAVEQAVDRLCTYTGEPVSEHTKRKLYDRSEEIIRQALGHLQTTTRPNSDTPTFEQAMRQAVDEYLRRRRYGPYAVLQKPQAADKLQHLKPWLWVAAPVFEARRK